MTSTATRYDRRMYAMMNNPAGKPLYATVARRRSVVAAHVVLTVAETALLLATFLGERMWVLFVMLALLLPWCVATGVINGATRGLLELRGRVLDERQLAERDRVHALAHRATTWLLAGGVLGVAAAGWLGEVRAEALVAPVLFGVLVVHWLMPLWMAGLLVRDEPADEVGEEVV